MRIGVLFPEEDNCIGTDLGAIKAYVQASESLGYHHLATGDHVLGANRQSRPGWKGKFDHTRLWHEPFVLFGYIAGITQNLELVTGILILPQRQTVLVAKQASAVDVMSGGRLRLGIGVGWNDVEYEALGENFHNRGERSEEQITVMRELWTKELVTFTGKWHKIVAAGLNPMPVQQPIPIWIGGGIGSPGGSKKSSNRVLKRIARIGDGWFPSVGLDSGVQDMINELHEYTLLEGRNPSDIGIEGSIKLTHGTPDDWRNQALAWIKAGATHIQARANFPTIDLHLDALERFREAMSEVIGQ